MIALCRRSRPWSACSEAAAFLLGNRVKSPVPSLMPQQADEKALCHAERYMGLRPTNRDEGPPTCHSERSEESASS